MSMTVPIWLDVLDETMRLCVAHGRNDLIGLVQRRRAQLLDPQLRVLVVGEPRKGKSQLVNALLNATVCPVGDAATTAVPTVVKHAPQPYAELVHGHDDGGRAVPLPLEKVAAEVAARHRPGAGPVHVEIGVPRGLLADGMVLIDTPGLDGHDPARLNEFDELARADVVLLVSDATRELSLTELNVLLHLARSHADIIVALTKTDMSPRWREVAERNRRHLAEVGVQATLIPVSATLRLRAAQTNDHETNAESGFPNLIARLVRDQRAKGDELARGGVHLLTRNVIEQLAAPLRAELSAEDSAPASDALSRLRDAQRAVDELRRCSVRWQNTLNDEMADLLSDLEFDLRDRTRTLLRKVDEAFDEADPSSDWEAFSQWLGENLIEAAEANYGWMLQRCDSITRRLADNFAVYGYGYDAMPAWSVRVPDDLAERVPEIEQPQVEKFTATQKVFSGLRGSYGGVLMFGLATSLAGMPLINPVSIGAGAVFGGKTIFDESKSLLKRRQAAAKTASQRHVDDFFLRFHKDCRDTARNIQRMLRDHFTALTEELQEAIVQSFRRAKQAADLDQEQRHRQIEQKMKQLAALYDQAQALVAGPGARTRARLEPRA